MIRTDLASQFTVSVIIPVYNGERYLAEALTSVLAQTSAPAEVIVVDDGSSDGSADIARSFGDSLRLVLQSNGGAAAARNRGVELAQGSYLAFLDADDVWHSAKLARQIAALNDNPALDMVFGGMKQFVSPELDETMQQTIHCPSEMMPGYTHCTMLIKRDSFQRVGPFQQTWQVGEFVDWYLRATEVGLQGLMLPELVMERRLHADNQGRHKQDYRKDYVRIVKASMDRRRQNLQP